MGRLNFINLLSLIVVVCAACTPPQQRQVKSSVPIQSREDASVDQEEPAPWGYETSHEDDRELPLERLPAESPQLFHDLSLSTLSRPPSVGMGQLQFRRLSFDPPIADLEITKILVVGTSLFVGSNRGLWHSNLWGTTLVPFSEEHGLDVSPIVDIVSINNALYVITATSLYVSSDSGPSFEIYNSRTGMPATRLNGISVTSDGRVFLATPRGLVVGSPHEEGFEYELIQRSRRQGTSQFLVHSLATSNTSVFLATAQLGVVSIPIDDLRIRDTEDSFFRADQVNFSQPQKIWTVDGDLYLGTRNEGLWKYSNGVAHRLGGIEGSWINDFLKIGSRILVTTDRSRTAVGVRAAFSLSYSEDGTTFRQIQRSQGVEDSQVDVMAFSDGRLYLGTSSGVYQSIQLLE